MLLALAASAPAAHAQRFEFDYTGSLVTFTVPIDGTYKIIAFGAQGGSSHVPFPPIPVWAATVLRSAATSA